MARDRELTTADLDRVVGGYVDGLRHRFEVRMDTLEGKVDRINGSVRSAHVKLGEHDGRLDQLHRRLEGLATSVHERVRDAYDRTLNAIKAHLVLPPTEKKDDGVYIRRVDLQMAIRIAIVCFGGGAGLVLWILRMMGKI